MREVTRVSAFVMLSAIAARTAAAAPVHEFAGLVLSPNAERIASIEEESPATGHQRIVIRERLGRVLEVSDPCQVCRYAHPAWSADGAALAYLAEGGVGSRHPALSSHRGWSDELCSSLAVTISDARTREMPLVKSKTDS
jgi:hypothetical protein